MPKLFFSINPCMTAIFCLRKWLRQALMSWKFQKILKMSKKIFCLALRFSLGLSFYKIYSKGFSYLQTRWYNNNDIYMYFLLLAQYFFVCYLDLLEIICILFPSLKGLLSNFASNLRKLINFYCPWN